VKSLESFGQTSPPVPGDLIQGSQFRTIARLNRESRYAFKNKLPNIEKQGSGE
jgi:hypothetical protein